MLPTPLKLLPPAAPAAVLPLPAPPSPSAVARKPTPPPPELPPLEDLPVPTLKELAEEGPLRLLDPWLIAGLVLTAILPILIRQIARRFNRPLDDGHESAVEESVPGVPARSHR